MTVRRRNTWSVGMMPTGLAQKDLDRNFLRDVAKFEIPNTKKMYALGRVIQVGVRRILGARGKHISWERLSPQKIIKEFRKKEKAAFDEMILRNLRLVIALSRRFGYAQMSGTDLVGYGVEGMMIAALRYDPKRKLRFSTYASWWIRHYMLRACQNYGQTVRTPVHAAESRRKVLRVMREFSQAHGYEPTRDQLVAATGMPHCKIENFLANTVTVFSLNKSVFTDNEDSVTRTTFEELIPDGVFPSPYEEAAKRIGVARMREAMRTVLNEREQTVLNLRFYEEITLNETAAHPRMMALRDSDQALSRERVRQIQEEALTKLRAALE